MGKLGRTRPAAGVRQEQQLEEMHVDGRTGGLEEVHVVAADTVVQPHVECTVWKTLDGTATEWSAELDGDRLGQGSTRRAGNNRHVHRCLRPA